MENKRNLLVTLADRNYVQQAKQLFSSVYWNAGWKGDYMLLSHEIPEKELKWFRDRGILVKKCRPLYDKFLGRFTPALLDKFYLFNPEFKKWGNIIYFDADIIVRTSLDKLTKIRGFGAIPDMAIMGLSNELAKDKQEELISEGYNLSKRYFNAGVFVFNTSIIKENTFLELKRIFKENSQICLYGDQEIFNLFFNKGYKRLKLIYNAQVPLFHHHARFSNINGIVLHFPGLYSFGKPWEKNNPFYQEWKNNLDKAELIDLNNIPEGKKWSSFKIMRLSLYIKIKYYLRYFFLKIKKIIQNIEHFFYQNIYLKPKNFLIYILYPKLKNTPDKLLGMIGQFIKKHDSQLYYKLKGIKK